jgi:DNA topoisomerase-1
MAATAAAATASPASLLPPLARPFASSSTRRATTGRTTTAAAAAAKAKSPGAATAATKTTAKKKAAPSSSSSSGPRAPALLVVESPTKAQKIQKFLGPEEYVVMASYGHVRDLSKKPGAVTTPPLLETEEEQQAAIVGGQGRSGKKAAEAAAPADGPFFDLAWELQPGADARLREMAKAARAAGGRVLLATDPDREGEAIAWHVAEELSRRGALASASSSAPPSSSSSPSASASAAPLRVTFTEITKSAVQEALSHPRPLLAPLVDAYFARRALDYLVGYTLSPVLWRRLTGARSAGRVQSVALGMLCAREAEIETFEPKPYWTLRAAFQAQADDDGGGAKSGSSSLLLFTARLRAVDGKRLGEMDVGTRAQADALLARIRASESQFGPWRVAAVTQSSSRRFPPTPFVTSTLQQAASSALGWSGTRTMRVAQMLYEGANAGEGLITYMRTDGTFVSAEGAKALREAARACYGPQLAPAEGAAAAASAAQPRRASAKNAQEAHEAIRPTRPLEVRPDGTKSRGTLPPGLTLEERQLYTLIWRRAVASQMLPAQVARVAADVEGAERCVVADGADWSSTSSDDEDDDRDSGEAAEAKGGRRKKRATTARAGKSAGGDAPALALRATGSVVTFEGFMAAWGSSSLGRASGEDDEAGEDEVNGERAGSSKRRRADSGAPTPAEPASGADARALRLLREGQTVLLARADADAHVTRPPPRYNDGSLVRALESAGVGRPSTYAPVLRLLEERGYASRGLPLPAGAQAALAAAAAVIAAPDASSSSAPSPTSSSSTRSLAPTPMGRLVSAFLARRFARYVDPSFTSSVEDRLDAVAAGEEAWRGVLGGFWGPFRQACADATGVSVEQVFKDLDAALEPYLFPRMTRRRGVVTTKATADGDGDGNEEKAEGRDPRRCPLCGGRLELKPARASFAFIGCGNYATKGCTYARPIAGAGGVGGAGSGGEQGGGGALLDMLRRARDDAAEALSSMSPSSSGGEEEEGDDEISSLRARRMAALESAEAALALGGAGRVLGRHPESGELVVARLGPYGAYVQLGMGGGASVGGSAGASPAPASEAEEEEEEGGGGAAPKKKKATKKKKAPAPPKPKRAAIPCARGEPPDAALASVTLERAVSLLSLPRDLGPHPDDGEAVVAARGPFGGYVKHRTLSAPLTLSAAVTGGRRRRGAGAADEENEVEGGSSSRPPLEPETVSLGEALALLSLRAERLRARGVQDPYDAAEVAASSPRGRARLAAAAAKSSKKEAAAAPPKAKGAAAAAAAKKKEATARSAPAAGARVAAAAAAAPTTRSPSGYTLFVREQGSALRAAAANGGGGGGAGLAAVAAAWRELPDEAKDEWRRRAAKGGERLT